MRDGRGFTLIELLIAITIVAILSSIGLVAYSSARRAARDAKRKEDLRAIKVSLELYYQKNNEYPRTSNWVFSSPTNSNWIPGLFPDFMAKIPSDPINSTGTISLDSLTVANTSYAYTYSSQACDRFAEGQFFVLMTMLENKNDPQRNEVQHYKYCDGKDMPWSGFLFAITSEQ